jgi:hypothetical protein
MSRSSIRIFQDARNATADQLDDLLARHANAREVGAGWTGLPADIASLSAALATLDKRLSEIRGER